MWRAPGIFLQAINNYINSDIISNVIIINNDMDHTPMYWPELYNCKITMLNMRSNMYVNPSWNLGVSIAQTDKICIANDDIIFDMKLLHRVYDRIIPENGVHGVIAGDPIFNQPVTTTGKIDIIPWKPGDHIHSFGQLMFLHKKNWLPIIPELKIYYGDDYIFHWHLYNKLTNYLIYNIHFYSQMAATTKDSSITGGVLERECPFFINWSNQYPLELQ